MVVKGIGNRLVVNHVGTVAGDVTTTTTVGGTTSTGTASPEPAGRQLFWWLFGVAGVIGAGAAVVTLLVS